MFVDRPDAFALDYNAELFQSLHGERGEVVVGVGVGGGVGVGVGLGGPNGNGAAAAVAHNTLTNSSPLVLHFNGGSKYLFGKFLSFAKRSLPPSHRCLPRSAVVSTSRGALALGSICPVSTASINCTS